MILVLHEHLFHDRNLKHFSKPSMEGTSRFQTKILVFFCRTPDRNSGIFMTGQEGKIAMENGHFFTNHRRSLDY